MLPIFRLYNLFWQSLDWIFPPQCGGCGRPGDRWCPDCIQHAPVIRGPVCDLCGQPLTRPGLCSQCRLVSPDYTCLRSWAIFRGPVRSALHRLKYKNDLSLGDSLSRHLTSTYLSLNWKVDVIIPVPLSQARRAQRGYNQVNLLALPFSLAVQIPYSTKALVRVKDTQSQVHLGRMDRLINVSGAFLASEKEVKDRVVLVIDDVTTTGATLSECAKALFNVGAKQVYCLTLARADFSEGGSGLP